MGPRFLSPARLGGAFLVASLVVGCGAKTGLNVPDAGPLNDGGLDMADLPDLVDMPDIPCIEVPIDGGPVEVSLETEAEVGRADVVFLIDTTSSMTEEINRIRARLRDQIAPAIRQAIPDSQMAVATFADFPIEPYGVAGRDVPFQLETPSTADVRRVQASLDAIRLSQGNDQPESQVEAMYQLATGEGIEPDVLPSFGCPSGGVGYACLREDALPVVMLFTDAPMHNGPTGAYPYDNRAFVRDPHVYANARAALLARDMRVIGFDSGLENDASFDLTYVARDTGAVDERDRPLVYDIGPLGEELGTRVVDAIRVFASSVVQDIDVVLRDPAPRDGFDVLSLVADVVPLSAEPSSGIAGIDFATDTFLGVLAGTRVTYEIVFVNGVVVPGTEPRTFLLEILFRGDHRRRLRRHVVAIVVPAADGTGCEGGPSP